VSRILVAGSIGTISQDSFSITTFNLLSRELRSNFKKIGNFFVGDKALEKLELGWRLVTINKSPKEYDLKLVK